MATPQGHVLDAYTEALWRMDSATGTSVPDAAGNGHGLSLTGSSGQVAGQVDYARTVGPSVSGLAGTNHFKSVCYDLARNRMLGEATVEGLAKISSLTGQLTLCTLSTGWGVVGGPSLMQLGIWDGAIYGSCGDTFNTEKPGVPLNTWCHLAWRKRIVSGAGWLDLFLNGVLVKTAGPFTLPALGGGNQSFWVGSNGKQNAIVAGVLDDIRVSNIARSASEIYESYRRTMGIDPPAVLASTVTPFPDELFTQPSAATETGTDCYAFPDLEDDLSLHSGPRLLADVLARRWTMARGSLRFHPDAGVDIRDYLNDEVDQARLFALKAELEAEAEADERISSANVGLTYHQDQQKLVITAAIESATGPFKLTLAATALTVELLSVEA